VQLAAALHAHALGVLRAQGADVMPWSSFPLQALTRYTTSAIAAGALARDMHA
jgi:hypothetical protein